MVFGDVTIAKGLKDSSKGSGDWIGGGGTDRSGNLEDSETSARAKVGGTTSGCTTGFEILVRGGKWALGVGTTVSVTGLETFTSSVLPLSVAKRPTTPLGGLLLTSFEQLWTGPRGS